MRLVAIPLARLRPGAQPVATFVAQRLPSSTTTSRYSSHAKLPLFTRLLARASDFWLGLGRDGQEPGKKLAVFDWKRRTFAAGEKLMDRIEYEEWALKAIDPVFGPSLKHATPEQNQQQQQHQTPSQSTSRQTVSLLYPPTLITSASLLTSLSSLTARRTPHHRSRLVWCIIGMPLTIPFALIPIVPNLPFFYLVWRAYSHWKAYRASLYLSSLLELRKLVPTTSSILDEVFASVHELPHTTSSVLTKPLQAPKADSQSSPQAETPQGLAKSQSWPSSAESSSPSSARPALLLNASRISLLGSRLSLDKQSIIELRRALQQTQLSIQKGKFEKIQRAAEGKGEAESATVSKAASCRQSNSSRF